MIRLLGLELRRFAWRRSFRVFGVIALCFIAVSAAIVAFNSHRGDDAVRAAAAVRRAMIEDCIENVPADQVPNSFDSVEEFCEEVGAPPIDSLDPRFNLTALTGIFGGTSIPLIILGLAFGASFIGAEWHAGTITPLLTWQPRRGLVFVSKAAAAMIGVFVFALALQAILGFVLWVVAATRGTTQGADMQWLVETAGVALRGAVIAGFLAVLGFAIGSVARNTTVALIIGFVYFAVAESTLRGLKPGWQPWLIGDNAARFVIGNTEEMFGNFRSIWGALIVVVAYAVIAFALATAWFRSRDVN